MRSVLLFYLFIFTSRSNTQWQQRLVNIYYLPAGCWHSCSSQRKRAASPFTEHYGWWAATPTRRCAGFFLLPIRSASVMSCSLPGRVQRRCGGSLVWREEKKQKIVWEWTKVGQNLEVVISRGFTCRIVGTLCFPVPSSKIKSTLMCKGRKLRLFIHSDISPFFLFSFHYSDEISAMDCLIIYVINNCWGKKK